MNAQGFSKRFSHLLSVALPLSAFLLVGCGGGSGPLGVGKPEVPDLPSLSPSPSATPAPIDPNIARAKEVAQQINYSTSSNPSLMDQLTRIVDDQIKQGLIIPEGKRLHYTLLASTNGAKIDDPNKLSLDSTLYHIIRYEDAQATGDINPQILIDMKDSDSTAKTSINLVQYTGDKKSSSNYPGFFFPGIKTTYNEVLQQIVGDVTPRTDNQLKNQQTYLLLKNATKAEMNDQTIANIRDNLIALHEKRLNLNDNQNPENVFAIQRFKTPTLKNLTTLANQPKNTGAINLTVQ